ncbi:BZ3500_MvSof-1268-A1-R1_Chr3-1g05721 [Microbotryum saponariae]|uniref:BZ3500_MvSof-1268-A1-R1_Chr3-1g05721 protein n=1 Tax=Microbotryum saponariae TaxID=289078 RepID=A0A2X0LDH4_9BASI|nr:BZ3500_MvSof-1268-A1-R1_Chr3-1g05721 [Microbotryum saponariae]SDA04911.1 BZ3501_MvSof-1269-A2-R1_Chr3-1g05391 [Microbotryum saponariae]
MQVHGLIRVRLAFETHHSLAERSSLTRTIRQIYQASLIPPPPVASTSNLKTASAPSSTPLPTTPIKNLRVGEPSLTHFYRGIFPTLFGIVPYAGVSFLVWGFLKTDLVPTMFSPSTRERHRTWIDLAAGGIAGALGQTSAYPLDIIRRRMQVGPVLPGGGGARHGFWDTARTIYKAHGWRGYFVGLSIGYLKVIFAYSLHERDDYASIPHTTQLETDRLNYIRLHQNNVRLTTAQGITDAVANGFTPDQIGCSVMLGSTFENSPREITQRYQDAMACVVKHGKPSLFIAHATVRISLHECLKPS